MPAAALDRAILVAIPTLNEAGHIATVLAQLADGLADPDRVGFVVVDGGSSDGTPAIVAALAAADPAIALLPNPQRLQSAAINRAVAAAGPTVAAIIRCDAHADYPPGFVAQVAAALDRSGADSVVVPMDSVGRSCFGRAAAWVSDTPLGSGGSAHRGGARSGFVDHGHHAGWRIESYRRAGGYDETFSHNEDAEFDCRLRAGGGRIWLDADIRLTYHVRSTAGALWRQYRNYGRGRSRTVRRHPASLRLRQFAVPSFVAANLAALLLAIVWPPALILPALYVLMLAAASLQVWRRRRTRCALLAGPAALVMHVAWACGFLEGLALLRERRWRPSAS